MRARAAIVNLVTNGLSGMDSATVQLDHILTDNDFYSVIPVASQYWSSGTVAPDDAHARFVGVQLRAVSMPTFFPVSFLGGAGNGYTAGASAVAGNDLVSCKPVPMFICNPFESGRHSCQRQIDPIAVRGQCPIWSGQFWMARHSGARC